jgi:hypothetical protein
LTIGAVREVLMTFQMKKIEETAKIAAPTVDTWLKAVKSSSGR